MQDSEFTPILQRDSIAPVRSVRSQSDAADVKCSVLCISQRIAVRALRAISSKRHADF